MRRAEAEALVGKKVSAWTSANGEYVGVLVEVKPTRPWRAIVLITGVTSPADMEYARQGRQRWGKRPGDVIEIGGVNVREIVDGTEGYPTYLECLQALRDAYERRIATYEEQVATFTASGDIGSCSRAQSDLTFCHWYKREIETLIEQEPERLERRKSFDQQP